METRIHLVPRPNAASVKKPTAQPQSMVRFGKLDDEDPPAEQGVLRLKTRGKGLAITVGGLIGLGATGGLLAAVNLYLLPMVATGVTIYGIRKLIKGK